MATKTDIWMPLYIGEYLSDTPHLSTIQHGAYLLLLMAYWKAKGPLEDDDAKLARITRLSLKQWCAMRPTIIKFFRAGDGQLVSTRSQREMESAAKKSEQMRANALGKNKTPLAEAPIRQPVCTDFAAPYATGSTCAPASPSQSQEEETTGAPREKPLWMSVGERVVDMIGMRDHVNWFGSAAPAQMWIEWGADPDLDIYPAIDAKFRKLKAQNTRIHSLSIFDEAVAKAIASRNRPKPEVSHVNGTGSTKPAKPTEESDGAGVAAILGIDPRNSGLEPNPGSAGVVIEGDFRRSN